jgi:hypothetical protein
VPDHTVPDHTVPDHTVPDRIATDRPPPPDPVAEERAALAGELRHWRSAVAVLADLDTVATPAAWAGLESYLGRSIRSSLTATTGRLTAQAERVAAGLAAAAGGADLVRVRGDLLRLRRRYVQVEAVVAFFGDAVGSRSNPRLGAVLRGLDALAVDSMDRVLRPLGIDTPPVLTYLDKGLGASILRAGARLWDASLSPAAAIKITHHNLWQPTSLVHETGHQVAHLTGWTGELAAALEAVLAPVSPLAARMWRSWASEVAADVYAFALVGYAPLPALACVVDGTTAAVLRMPLGDPHPFGWLRVWFNAALCRSWYGPGPWDRYPRVWARRHPLERADPYTAEVARASLPLLPALAEVCTREPMRAFGGRPLSALVDPRRVAPAELARLAGRAGPSLLTSSYLQRLEPMRILAWTVLREQSAEGAAATAEVETWLRRLGGERIPAA